MKFLLVIVLIAIAVYLTIRVIERRGLPPSDTARRRPPQGPMGPDDDPDFLRGLDRDGRDRPDRPDAGDR